ncbi:MAG: ABC transporter ATP-binding protein [Deltaproteobacteria bacterium]|nr:ABC transporter ATP-binding protein [Deltaproteobacteria bacterium]
MASITDERLARFTSSDSPVLSVAGLSVSFKIKDQWLSVIRDVTFHLPDRTRTGILGETGCGKSVMALAIFSLLPANALVRGAISFENTIDLVQCGSDQLARLRGDAMVLIPQNPQSHLNPVFTIGFQVDESVKRLGGKGKRRVRKRTKELLTVVGFSDPDRVTKLHAHELSGGMAQRVLLAIGLAGNSRLIVADEPTKGLDEEARDKYIQLTQTIYHNAAFLIITHDLEVARSCERIMVLYAGTVVEDGPSARVLRHPRHPYTQGLLAAHPSLGLNPIPGNPPSLSERTCGCGFYPRRACQTAECGQSDPRPKLIGEVTVRCIHA